MPKEMISATLTRAQGQPWGFVIGIIRFIHLQLIYL
jgi:hypothetical protein